MLHDWLFYFWSYCMNAHSMYGCNKIVFISKIINLVLRCGRMAIEHGLVWFIINDDELSFIICSGYREVAPIHNELS